MGKSKLVKERKYNVIYVFCFWLIYPFFKLFFRKIKVAGLENYNSSVPTIFAANHNNAFLDAMVLHFILFENIYSLARGDVFKNSVSSYFLSLFHVLPIFRMSEGAENLHRNEKSFLMSVEVLSTNNALLIFPEGNCIQEKKLRPFKKGLARIAFMAESKNDFSLNLKVIPVGINYTHPDQFRGNLDVNFGKPISLIKYKEEFLNDQAKTFKRFTDDVYRELKSLVVHVNDHQTYFDTMIKNNPMGNLNHKLLAEKFNQLILDELKKIDLFKLIDEQKKYLLKYKIDYENIKNTKNKSFGYVLLGITFFIVFFPAIFTALVLNFFPFYIFPKLSNKAVKNKEFYLSVLIGISSFGYLIYSVLISLLFSNIFELNFLVFFLCIPLSGLFLIWSIQYFKTVINIAKLSYYKTEGLNINSVILKYRKRINEYFH